MLSQQILTRAAQAHFVHEFQPIVAMKEHESFAESAHEKAHLQSRANVISDFRLNVYFASLSQPSFPERFGLLCADGGLP